MHKEKTKFLKDALCFVAGAIVYSIAVNVFLSPSGISPGGFTGLATIVNSVTNIPTGIVLFLFNVPVIILGYFKLGGKFVLKTALVTTLVSITLDVSAKVLSTFKSDKTLSALFGGILMGIGLSLILLRGATTGGVDVIAKLINRKHRHLSIGKIILVADGVVIALNAITYKNLESALYSIVAMYIGTRITDVLLYGADKGKLLYIITSSPDMICKEINHTSGRGVTKLQVTGGYTNENRTMLMCAVRVHEVGAIYETIRKYDKNAFVVVSDAGEILGEGFKQNG